MKIAVSSTGRDLNSQIDPRFGRCAYFVIVDTDDMDYESFENENAGLSGGAGIQSATFLSSKNVMAVLTGNCGPNAIKTLSAGGIKTYTGQTGTVREAVEKYLKDGLTPSTRATVAEKSGIGRTGKGNAFQPQTGPQHPDGYGKSMGMSPGRGMGMGGGRGMGSGRGIGGGRGMGMGRSGRIQDLKPGHPNSTEEESLAALKKLSADLQNQLEEIQTKIKNLE